MGRLLVVDDDYILLESMAAILASSGHDIIQAKDGLEAVRLYKFIAHGVIKSPAYRTGEERFVAPSSVPCVQGGRNPGGEQVALPLLGEHVTTAPGHLQTCPPPKKISHSPGNARGIGTPRTSAPDAWEPPGDAE